MPYTSRLTVNVSSGRSRAILSCFKYKTCTARIFHTIQRNRSRKALYSRSCTDVNYLSLVTMSMPRALSVEDTRESGVRQRWVVSGSSTVDTKTSRSFLRWRVALVDTILTPVCLLMEVTVTGRFPDVKTGSMAILSALVCILR